jgi:hypothetical protein
VSGRDGLPASGGPRGRRTPLRPEWTLHDVALDIGASKWLIGRRVGDRLVLLARGRTTSFASFASDLAAIAARLEARTDSVGCAFPGGIANGVVTAWPRRPEWRGAPLADTVRDAFGARRVAICDDGSCAVAGEALLGCFRGDRDLLVLSLGSGLGGGFCLGGEVRPPRLGDARTIGHVRALSDRARCACGGTGCLQTAFDTLPPPTAPASEPAVWPAGAELAETCADMCRVLGVGDAVLTGGLMNRTELWRMLHDAFGREGIRCWRPADPSMSTVMGALVSR